MNKLLKMALAGALVLGLSTSVASANAAKGQKLFSKYLKTPCNMTGAKMAAKHTQDEWDAIYNGGKLPEELKSLCPSADEKALSDKFMESYFNFFYEYASDSGNVPAC